MYTNNTNTMNKYIPLVAVLGVGMVLGYLTGQGSAETSPVETQVANVGEAVLGGEETIIDVALVNHILLGLPEQDAFIETDEDPSMVFRVEGEAAADPLNLAKQAYAVTEETHHDAFKVGDNPVGPYKKGADLGFTLGEWLAGEGAGTYTVTDGKATLDLTFTDLVPNGVYTLWCSRVTLSPIPNIVDLPCGEIDGSTNAFTADADGNATVANLAVQTFNDSTETTVNVIAVAYHSDGNTYGPKPGEFGLNSHVQLAFIVPAPSAE